MKLNTGTIIALLVAVLLGVFISFYEQKLPTTEQVTATERHLIPVRKADDAVGVAVTAGEQRWSAARAAGSNDWRLTEPVADAADAAAIGKVLAVLLERDGAARIELTESDTPGTFGFDHSAGTIRVTFSDGSAVEITVGSAGPLGQGNYAQVAGARVVHLVPGIVAEVLQLEVESLRRAELVGPAAYRANRLEITGDSGLITLREENNQWRMTAPAAVAVNRRTVEGILSRLATLKARGWLEAAPDSMVMYGLQPPKLEVVISEGDTRLAALRFGKLAPGGTILTAADDRPWVMAVEPEFALSLPTDPADYVSRVLVPFGMYEVEYLEVTGDGRTDSMARTENGEWAGVPTAAGEAAVGAIANLPLTAVAFLPDATPPRPPEQAAYTLIAKSATGQSMTLRLWREGDTYLVWREGEPLRGRLAAAAFTESLKNFR